MHWLYWATRQKKRHFWNCIGDKSNITLTVYCTVLEGKDDSRGWEILPQKICLNGGGGGGKGGWKKHWTKQIFSCRGGGVALETETEKTIANNHSWATAPLFLVTALLARSQQRVQWRKGTNSKYESSINNADWLLKHKKLNINYKRFRPKQVEKKKNVLTCPHKLCSELTQVIVIHILVKSSNNKILARKIELVHWSLKYLKTFLVYFFLTQVLRQVLYVEYTYC